MGYVSYEPVTGMIRARRGSFGCRKAALAMISKRGVLKSLTLRRLCVVDYSGSLVVNYSGKTQLLPSHGIVCLSIIIIIIIWYKMGSGRII